jgi:acyl phosphate:glycerol-3-phosphate acyltransferase
LFSGGALETCPLIEFFIKVLAAYFLGSLLGSLIIGKLRGGVDIRTLGSGNAGGTNALRTQGPWFALGVMVIDVGKGWFAAALLPVLRLPGLAAGTEQAQAISWLSLACAAAVVIGHVYPVWFGFRGGKGAATLIGVVLGLHAMAAVPTMLVWVTVLLLTGYVGLATMLAALSFPLYAQWGIRSEPLLIFGIAMALFVIFTHRANISRMVSGTESRAMRLWLLRPR